MGRGMIKGGCVSCLFIYPCLNLCPNRDSASLHLSLVDDKIMSYLNGVGYSYFHPFTYQPSGVSYLTAPAQNPAIFLRDLFLAASLPRLLGLTSLFIHCLLITGKVNIKIFFTRHILDNING